MRWDATMRAGGRAVLLIFGLAVGLLALAGIAVEWLRSDGGRAFVVAQLIHIKPHSGLRVGVARIDGNPLTRFIAHGVVLSDPAGPFLTIPVVSIDWRPFAFAANRLVLHAVEAPTAHLIRLPKFVPSIQPDQPILPGFDIALGHLRVDRVRIDAAVAGRAAVAALAGNAEVAAGRAVVNATARATSGDRLALALDARPDDDRFALKADLAAPANGLVAGLSGLGRATALHLDGKGSWTHWRGTLAADLGTAPLARLALAADGGRFAARGTLAPAAALGAGIVAQLSGPTLAVQANATMANRRLSLAFAAQGAGIALTANGPVDLARSTVERIAFKGRLPRPELIAATLRGDPIDFSGTVSGPFGLLAVAADARSAILQTGTTALIAPQLNARGTFGRGPPGATLRLTAARVTGLPPQLADLASGIVAQGPVTLANGVVRAEGVFVRTTRVTARASATYALATGAYAVGIDGALPGYTLPGVGIADLNASLRIAPGPGGRGVAVAGPVRARVTRLENGALRTLAGGLPVITGRATVPPGGGGARLDDLLLAAPRLRLTGQAALGPGDAIRAHLTGQSTDYGPVELTALGTTAKPALDLALAHPGLGVGLADVRAQLRPDAQGFEVHARGRSTYGPFVADLGLATSGGFSVDVRAFTLAGLSAHGRIAPAGPVYAGDLILTGQGLHGDLRLADQAGVQRADLTATLTKARLLPLDPQLAVGQGRITATLLLPPGGPEGNATLDLASVTRGTLLLRKVAARGSYAHGQGSVHLATNGEANAPFALVADATLAPERIVLAASGDIDGQPVRFAAPAIATHSGGVWRLAPATLLVAGGQAVLGGTLDGDTRLTAQLASIHLDALGAIGALNVRGTASGSADLLLPAHGLPQGNARLFVTRFSRAGLAVSSLPVEIEAAAALKGDAGAMRGFIRREGKVLGAFQAQLSSIPGTSAQSPTERLLAAPLRGEVRLQAPAEAIWPLAGVDALDVRGPIGVSASIAGHLGEPQIAGVVNARGARLEAAALGTTITAIDMDGRFDGPTLTLTRFTGKAGNGSLSGSGRISLTDAQGFTVNLKAQLANALMLKTDTLRAAVSGPATITLDQDGGVIGGDVRIDSARYQLGTTPAEQVPVLKVREIGTRPPTGRAPVSTDTQWSLDIHAVARSRFNVRGLGLDSDWGADVRIGGSALEPEITGRATLARGTYDFSGKTFRLDRGDIRFTGEYPPNPSIDIQATANVTGLTAVLNIGGSAFKPEIVFTSTPALPEDEVLSRLLFGTSVTDLSAPEALQLAAAVAQLRGGNGGGLNPVNALRRVTGLDRLRVNGADKTTGRGTSVAAGKYIGRNVYVEVASDAKGYTATQIEISLTRWLSLLSSVASQGSNRVSVRVSKDY